jgi:hypothetical protein
MISVASPKVIAGRIASAHNRRECRHCQRPLEGGVFTFGTSGSDARWFPSLEQAQRETSGPRFMFPVREQPVSREEVEAWIEQARDELEQHVEHVEHERAERRAQREAREADRGFVTSIPCFSCGKPKKRPSDECYHCGDVPTQHNSSPAEVAAFNRAYGAAA